MEIVESFIIHIPPISNLHVNVQSDSTRITFSIGKYPSASQTTFSMNQMGLVVLFHLKFKVQNFLSSTKVPSSLLFNLSSKPPTRLVVKQALAAQCQAQAQLS